MPQKTAKAPEPYSWRTSLFYQRLSTLSDTGDTGSRELLTKVDHIAGQAADISNYVVAFLPQYTDHGERHLTNVLHFMEELAGKESIGKLSALECALAIMAAMTHDLGMVLDAEEQKAVNDSADVPTTPEGKAWQTYRDGNRLWHAYQKLTPAERATDRARQMFGQLKADYIRDSHAKELGQRGYHRILRWLDVLAKGKGDHFYRHDRFSFREGLAHLGMSHGQDIGWLAARLAATDSPYAEIKEDPSRAFACGPDEVNWPWLSWLLRLAGVMDFDASRTPPVLFESIGIADALSQTEWKKHLSIPQRPKFKQDHDKQTLLYLCPLCPDPFTEKAIHDILGWINDEIAKVRHARDTNAKHLPDKKKLTIELPSEAKVKISERAGNYHYLDLHFRLDRDAVMELLMGEALYGEPDLALRELVQNSLDALHLRDLRVKLRRKLKEERAGEELPVPVALLDDEKLEVRVRWHTQKDKTQRPWIEVEDNGVGMTKDVIERFLTQIGKSYYKSPDFLRERELMKRHGLLCTTISQFGIGFLSAFMLADEVEIETRAAAKDGGPEAGWRVKIHGAHGLIALYPLERNAFIATGTRVRLTLKDGLELEPFQHEQFLKRLRHLFHEQGKHSGDKGIEPPAENLVEPAWSVARCVVWPFFPVRLCPDSVEAACLDEGFHHRELLPLNVAAIRAKAAEWTFLPASVGEPRWQTWDWVDDGPDGTGSRIRLTLPWHTEGAVGEQAANDVAGLMRRSELLSLTEPQLPVPGRTLVLVNGVLVPGWKEPLARWLEQVDGVGAFLWLDLRGPATPRLKADRRAPTRRQEVESLARALQRRFHQVCARRSVAAEGWLRLAVTGLAPLRNITAPQAWSLGPRLPRLANEVLRGGGGAYALIQEFARDRDRDRDRDRALTRDRDLALDRDRARDLDLDLARDRNPILKIWFQWLQAQFLPEGLQPSLEQAFAPWCVPGLSGPAGHLVLGGPLVLRQPTKAPSPVWAGELDLLVPLTGNPLGRLASQCPRWATERWLRPLFTLPFMLGEVPEPWRESTEDIVRFLGVDSLLAYVPDSGHWERAFTKIPPEDFGDGPVPEFVPQKVWRDSGVTALWDIKTGRVLWAEKFRTREEMRRLGKSLDEWAKQAQ